MVEVFAVRIDKNLKEEEFNKLMTLLTDEKKSRIKRFLKKEDSIRALIADILIRYIACKKLNLKNDQLDFTKNEYGKPVLLNSKDFHFNLSHSGLWVAGAVHNMPIGIDIEKIKQMDFDIAKRFFSEEEYRDIMRSTNKLEYFFELWTLKESYVKALGTGLTTSLDSFSIKIDNGKVKISNFEDYKYFFKQYDIDKNYKMAICSKENNFPEGPEVYNIEELYEEALLLF